MTDRVIQMAKKIDGLVRAGKAGPQIIEALLVKYPDMKPTEFKRAFGIAIDEKQMDIELGEEDVSTLRSQLAHREDEAKKKGGKRK